MNTIAAVNRRRRLPAGISFLIAWMLHIGTNRVMGCNLRTSDGFNRA
jgi:hypothetical protein